MINIFTCLSHSIAIRMCTHIWCSVRRDRERERAVLSMAVHSRCAIKRTTIKINWTIFQLIDDFCLLSIRSKLNNFIRITLTLASTRPSRPDNIIVSLHGICSLALDFSFSRFSETITSYLPSNGAESCNGCNL